MEEVKLKIQKLKKLLSESSKERILCISTTANINNPQVFIGGIRETNSTIAGNIILRDKEVIQYIIDEYDGFVEYFMIDCEIKNEIKDLESYIIPLIKKSKIAIYKPNDFAVESLDVLISTICVSLLGKNVFIVGAGNLGSKISLKLCERGANVFLFDRDKDKLEKIIEGINLIKRSNTDIKKIDEIASLDQLFDVVIGCTQGLPAVTPEVVSLIKNGGIIIDAGNGTISTDAINLSKKRNNEIICLSSLPGYVGMIENWLLQRDFLKSKKSLQFGQYSVVTLGILGARGDIIVDSIEHPARIIGMCDGKGDILDWTESQKIFTGFFGEFGNEKYVLELKSLYDKI